MLALARQILVSTSILGVLRLLSFKIDLFIDRQVLVAVPSPDSSDIGIIVDGSERTGPAVTLSCKWFSSMRPNLKCPGKSIVAVDSLTKGMRVDRNAEHDMAAAGD